MLQRIESAVILDAPLTSILLSGDPGCDGYNTEAVIIFERILREETDLHLVLGDLVPTGQDRWFRQFASIVSGSASAPVYCLPGNHDLPDYGTHLGLRNYTIEAPNLLLTLLDNAGRYFDEAALELLRSTLSTSDNPNVIVGFHIPPPNPFVLNHIRDEEWRKLRRILDPHKDRIRLLVSGHVHSAFDYDLEGYRVMVTGGAGAGLDPVENTFLARNAYHAIELRYVNETWVPKVLVIPPHATGADAARAPLSEASHAALAEAFQGESEARRRYELFSDIAEAEGRPNLARLFRAASESEHHHSRNMFLALHTPRSSQENLQHSIQRETEEIEELYPDALARFEADETASTTHRGSNAFSCALAAERVHRRLFQEALQIVGAECDIPPTNYYTCQRCGFTAAGERPPAICPACGADRYKFSEVV